MHPEDVDRAIIGSCGNTVCVFDEGHACHFAA
jgi:hypothetical protein